MSRTRSVFQLKQVSNYFKISLIDIILNRVNNFSSQLAYRYGTMKMHTGNVLCREEFNTFNQRTSKVAKDLPKRDTLVFRQSFQYCISSVTKIWCCHGNNSMLAISVICWRKNITSHILLWTVKGKFTLQ